MTRPPAGTLAGVLPGALAATGLAGMPDPLGLTALLDGPRQVAVLLVDGLGHHLLPAAGAVAPALLSSESLELSSAFPSTTPTSLVSIGTGALPGAHGVVGFTVNVPGTDRVLTHILWGDDPPPREWQPRRTVFEQAAAAGARVAVVGPREFAGSGLTVSAYGSVRYVGTSPDVGLGDAMARELGAGTRLVYGYHPTLDQTAHRHGIASEQWRAVATEVGDLVAGLAERLPAGAVLLVTADHGCLDVPPEGRPDIDTDPRLSAGVRVVAGEPRVRYLHTVPGARDDVVAAWRAVLGDGARILTREEAVDGGWFGPVTPEHLPRIGDVIAICRGRTVVLASAHEPDFIARMVGFHGSVTPEETAVPLLIHRSR